MSTEALISPQPNRRLGSFTAAHKTTHALRYDDLSRVLINFDQHLHVQEKPKRKSGRDQAELAELWAQVASLKAENDRLSEQIADELDRVADRIAKVEAQTRSWWCRMLDQAGDRVKPNRPPRNRASERLKALYFGTN
jgi:hypothetical protein